MKALRDELKKLKAYCESGRCRKFGYAFCDKCEARMRIIEIKKRLDAHTDKRIRIEEPY